MLYKMSTKSPGRKFIDLKRNVKESPSYLSTANFLDQIKYKSITKCKEIDSQLPELGT